MSPATVTTLNALEANARCLSDCADRLLLLSENVGLAYANSLRVAASNAQVSANIVEITVRLMEKDSKAVLEKRAA